ncbi:DUF2232 domain-containing protein [Paenibacillus sp. CAA11]|uniref:DUF2232 domain-containing protein n=1 Tax=Paenibacillus sp. CAA11 TaxID=1532905 RepID=UPI000D3AC12C|nr:DUF2232 domain-containing protein [Paenibacillus sp. CAA11]AWB46694.1 DUF2232 domain-containing protein [Paenibacillus sp. CAA11]
MKIRWTSIAWSAAYLLLFLSMGTPLIVITAFFMLLPGVVLYTMLSTQSFLWHVVPVLAIVSILLGPTFILLAIFFLIPSMLMGYMYKKRAAAFRTVAVGAAAILIEFLVMLFVSTTLFGFDIASTIEDTITKTAAPIQGVSGTSLADTLGWSAEAAQEFSSLTVRLIPFTLIICSLIMATVAHALAWPTLGSMGITTPKLAPIREWKLPRSLVWYYIVGLLLSLITGYASQGFLGTILLNLMPMLLFCFMVQTAGFFFFAAHVRKWNPVIPIFLTILLVFFQPLRIIGIIDILFPLREFFTRTRR